MSEAGDAADAGDGREIDRVVGARLETLGQRYTGSRRALVAILARAGRPLSIADVLATGSGLPQSSVYRNLAVLEQAGAVRRLPSPDGYTRFELTEDLTEHHHHLVCVGCGAVDDYTAPQRLERTMARAIEAVAADTGFRPQGHRFDVMGLCHRCA